MGGHELRLITEADVVNLVTLNDAIEALRKFVVEEAENKAENVPKTLGMWDGGSLHAIGAFAQSLGYAAFKTWINTPQGAQAVVNLFDVNAGRLLGVIEAGTLGSLRTGGISGLATDWLANPDADEMALIGTGRQAMMQIASVGCVRKLKRVKVFSPRSESRQQFTEQAGRLFPFPIEPVGSLEAAVSETPIVTLVTRSREPFLAAGMVSPGTHINAVGAILPGHSEIREDLFDRVSLCAVDNVRNVTAYSEEFKPRFRESAPKNPHLHTIGELIYRGIRRNGREEITLFKPMGMGLSDLAVASLVYERACEKGIGTLVGAGAQMLVPRWLMK